MTEEQVIKLLEIMNTVNVSSLNSLVRKQDDDSLCEIGDLIPDDNDLQEQVEKEDRINILNKAVELLPPRQQQIINLRYGLKDGQYRTLDEVAALYGVTRERIRQIECKAIQKLKIIIRVKFKLKAGDL